MNHIFHQPDLIMMSFSTKAFALSNNKMAMVSVDDSILQVDSQPQSVGFV